MIRGLHPYLPCERCFRLPPGPAETVNGKTRLGTAPYCHCLTDAAWQKIYVIIAEERRRIAAEVLKDLPVIPGKAAA